MAIDTRPPGTQRPAVKRSGRSRDSDRDGGASTRSLLLALVLACLTLMVVDKAGGDDSPVAPVRQVIGDVVGPLQAGAATVVRPVADLPGALRSNASLRDDLAALEAENAELSNQLARTPYDDQRLAQLEGLRAMAGDLGYALVPARVIAIGPAQSFASTVTLDAGSDQGLAPDMTVVAAEGLVGRVTAVTSRTATVLLIIDPTSAVGGRIGESMELGFVNGHGRLGQDERLEMELADRRVVPKVGQAVVTWGSRGGSPYVAGVPIGSVGTVYESLRDNSYRAEITPAVDFTTLDLVGVVVPSGTDGRVIEADGSFQ